MRHLKNPNNMVWRVARDIEPAPFSAIADEVGALMMFDIAHIAGLVAGGALALTTVRVRSGS